jgi:hypothetical protein
MKLIKATTAMGLVVAAAAVGCKSSTSEPSTASAKSTPAPAAQPTAPTETTMAPVKTASAPTAAAPTPAIAAPALAEKDMTHVLAKDEGYFSTTPTAGKKPDGTLKAGTKVVVMMPRGPYSQVMTADGKRVYTTTAALKPVGS